MTLLKLAPLKSEQLSALIELDRLCFGGLWTLEGYQRELESPNSELWVISTPATSQLNTEGAFSQVVNLVGIGCFWAILDEAHVTILGIHPDFRGQGLGQLLLWQLLECAYKRELHRATLEVRESNVTALSLYQKFGFQIAGRRKKYYQNPTEDALILWRGGLDRPQFQQELATWQQEIDVRLKSLHSYVFPSSMSP